jgi:hypothetical protein
MITNAPWYVSDQTLHDDLKVPYLKVVTQEKVSTFRINEETIVIPYCNHYWNSHMKKAKETLASGPN